MLESLLHSPVDSEYGFVNRLKLLFETVNIFEERSISTEEVESLKSAGALKT